MQKLSTQWFSKHSKKQFLRSNSPIVSSNVNLVSSAAPQILQGVLGGLAANLYGLPLSELRFVVDGVTVQRSSVRGMRSQFHCNRVGCGGCQCNLRGVRWRWNKNTINYIIREIYMIEVK